jgi:uncharacterized protein with PIN domain
MSGQQVELRFAAELRMFLAPRHRGGTVRVTGDGTSSLGHVIESLGVPLTEVGCLTVAGREVTPRYRLHHGDPVTVGVVRRPQALPSARFVLDVHLGTLARRLRLLGVDTAYSPDAEDPDLVEASLAERRVLLTRDRGLLHRRALRWAAHVRSDRPDEQAREVLTRFDVVVRPWTRCLACNGLLEEVAKADVADRLEPGTRRTQEFFVQCTSCGKVYWRGAHQERLRTLVDRLSAEG